MRLISNLNYAIKQGIKGTFKNKTMGFLSVVSVAAVLLILGVVMSIVTNINQFIISTEEEINEVKVMIEDSISQIDQEIIKEEIFKIDGVNAIVYENKYDQFKSLQESWGEDAHLLEGIENPLDDMFVVTVEDSTMIQSMEEKLMQIENVIAVEYHQDIMENFLSLSNTVTRFGSVIILFLLLVCLVLISNTIRSKVHNKKEEIQIIKYVGGSNKFITAPFIVEGFTIGLVGSIISISSCVGIYKYVIDNMANFNSELISTTLLSVNEVSTHLIPVLLIIGIGIGVVGSFISVRRYIKV